MRHVQATLVAACVAAWCTTAGAAAHRPVLQRTARATTGASAIARPLRARAARRSARASGVRMLEIDAETLRSIGPMGMAAVVCGADMIPGAPTQPIAIAAGALFGLPNGLLAVCVGQAFAAAGALTLSRTPAVRELILSKEQELESESPNKLRLSLNAVAKRIDSQGFWGVIATVVGVRQSPIIPFSLGNYYLGLFTRAPPAAVLAGTLVGCFPLNALWVYVGASTQGALEKVLAGEAVDPGELLQSPAGSALEVLGGLATLAIVVAVGRAMASESGVEEDAA